jgi:hypothetical protein
MQMGEGSPVSPLFGGSPSSGTFFVQADSSPVELLHFLKETHSLI